MKDNQPPVVATNSFVFFAVGRRVHTHLVCVCACVCVFFGRGGRLVRHGEGRVHVIVLEQNGNEISQENSNTWHIIWRYARMRAVSPLNVDLNSNMRHMWYCFKLRTRCCLPMTSPLFLAGGVRVQPG